MRRSGPDLRRLMAPGAAGGGRRMALRRPGRAPLAFMGAGGLGGAARGPSASPRQAAETAAAHPAAPSGSAAALPARAKTRVSQAAFNEDADGARVVLSADAPLLYTAYEPRPDLLVVDLPGTDLSPDFASPAGSGSLVTAIRIEPVLEMGKPLTRISLTHQAGLRSDVRGVGGRGLAISFEPAVPPAEPAAALTAETVTAAAEAAVAPPPVVWAQPRARAAAPQGEPAHQLEESRVSGETGAEVPG